MKKKNLYIIKTGTTFPLTAGQFGDFDAWTSAGLGATAIEVCVLDVEHGAGLPPAEDCAGVVITGSHAMVTDELPWSLKTEKWIPSLLETHTPLLGICYGHQLLARAAGGRVGFHPSGKEIGTVRIRLLPDSANDALFMTIPQSFRAHVTHSQTVLRLPPEAVRLAANGHEPNHAFRIGDSAWGVQFHPEYDTGIMRSYITEQSDEIMSAGIDIPGLLGSVVDTPAAAKTLKNFIRIVEKRPAVTADTDNDSNHI